MIEVDEFPSFLLPKPNRRLRESGGKNYDFMDSIIKKIRELSLRNWVLISLGLTVFAFLIIFVSNNYSGFKLCFICSRLGGLTLLLSLAVYAVNSENKIKIISILAIAGFVISVYSLYDTFNDPWVLYNMIPASELMTYYAEKATSHGLIENFTFILAFAIGLGSLNKRYRIPWIIYMVAYSLTLLNLILHSTNKATDNDVLIVNVIIGLLMLVGLIVLLVKGGKDLKTIDNNQSVSQTSGATMPISPASMSETTASTIVSTPSTTNATTTASSIISKSKELYQLKELLDSGVLTAEEFNTEKTKILNSI